MDKQKVKIAWFGKHFGEEPPLVGVSGAGTIFFTGCNLKCVFCQNWQISHDDIGKDYTIEELADVMIGLQADGAVNIDLVTPTPWRRLIKEAIVLAKEKGLKIPIAWNSNGYESVAAIRDLEGFVDIYLPDFKYGDDEVAKRYSNAPKYSEVADKAIREMIRQVGLLRVDDNGLAVRGVIVRHLILPNNLTNTFSALEKIASIDKNVHLSLMSQYYPVFDVQKFPELGRQVSLEEIAGAESVKMELGLSNGWVQEMNSGEIFLPDFNSKNPFAKKI
jgi:putative pyruvate formate lyase activating enzyme